MSWQEMLGFVGGALTTVSFAPQAWRLFKLKSAHEISLIFNIIFLLGIVCWLCYGLLFKLFPLILWNSLTFTVVFIMLIAKLKFDK
jgi:MtN3 and saliva related transmembrane protein